MGIDNIENFLKIKMPSIRESLNFTKYRLSGGEKGNISLEKGDEVTYI